MWPHFHSSADQMDAFGFLQLVFFYFDSFYLYFFVSLRNEMGAVPNYRT